MASMIIIMGVSGSGKTTVGKRLAKALQLPFYDGDDFHPKNNIDKMKQNIPLNDDDRKPWLEDLAVRIKNWSSTSGGVLACSALKESYRELLSSHVKTLSWIFLHGSFKIIQQRIEGRNQHFMKSNLLQSQFNTLEVPSYGLHVSIEQEQEQIISEIIQKLSLNG